MYIDGNVYTELEDYPNYFISDTSLKLYRLRGTEFIECKQCPNSVKDNYPTVTVTGSNGVRYKRNMHRLLAETFIPNPLNKAHVNHLDGNKANNLLSNLEWATEKENAQHAVAMGLTTNEVHEIEVHMYHPVTGKYIRSFKSAHEADRQTNAKFQNLGKVCLGKRRSAGGYIWSFTKTDRMQPLTKGHLTVALKFI